MTSTLTFGNVPLDRYLAPITTETDSEQLRRSLKKRMWDISEQIEKLSEREVFEIEKPAIERLKREKESLTVKLAEVDISAVYPLIDPSFLSLANSVNFYGMNFSLPKFSVYRAYGENSFSIGVDMVEGRLDNSLYGWIFGWWVEKLKILINEGNPIPSIFINSLIKTTDFNGIEYKRHRNLPKKIQKKYDRLAIISDTKRREEYRKLDYEVREKRLIEDWAQEREIYAKYGVQISDYVRIVRAKFENKFSGIVPETTKEKVREASRAFDKNELYFIAEIKPEDWNVSSETSAFRGAAVCPLVIGVKYDKCFLIDKFDTTSLENYVSHEFTMGSLEN